MKDAMRRATEQERDRLKDFIANAAKSWIGDVPGLAGRDSYMASLNAALKNVEEALRIINDAKGPP